MVDPIDSNNPTPPTEPLIEEVILSIPGGSSSQDTLLSAANETRLSLTDYYSQISTATQELESAGVDSAFQQYELASLFRRSKIGSSDAFLRISASQSELDDLFATDTAAIAQANTWITTWNSSTPEEQDAMLTPTNQFDEQNQILKDLNIARTLQFGNIEELPLINDDIPPVSTQSITALPAPDSVNYQASSESMATIVSDFVRSSDIYEVACNLIANVGKLVKLKKSDIVLPETIVHQIYSNASSVSASAPGTAVATSLIVSPVPGEIENLIDQGNFQEILNKAHLQILPATANELIRNLQQLVAKQLMTSAVVGIQTALPLLGEQLFKINLESPVVTSTLLLGIAQDIQLLSDSAEIDNSISKLIEQELAYLSEEEKAKLIEQLKAAVLYTLSTIVANQLLQSVSDGSNDLNASFNRSVVSNASAPSPTTDSSNNEISYTPDTSTSTFTTTTLNSLATLSPERQAVLQQYLVDSLIFERSEHDAARATAVGIIAQVTAGNTAANNAQELATELNVSQDVIAVLERFAFAEEIYSTTLDNTKSKVGGVPASQVAVAVAHAITGISLDGQDPVVTLQDGSRVVVNNSLAQIARDNHVILAEIVSDAYALEDEAIINSLSNYPEQWDKFMQRALSPAWYVALSGIQLASLQPETVMYKSPDDMDGRTPGVTSR